MAWIESHQELRHHPKLSAVCRTLSANPIHMIGHLHCLWWWCMDYAMDGEITKYTPQQIADAAGWGDDAEKFINALIESGFLDRNADVTLIHDWSNYQLHYDVIRERKERQREQIRNRVKKWRESKKDQRSNADVTQSNATTIPNQTQPNHTVPKKEKDKTRRFEKPTAAQVTLYARSIGFNLDGQKFWDYYESKGWVVGKAAMKSWQAAVRTWKSNEAGPVSAPVMDPAERERRMAVREKELERLKALDWERQQKRKLEAQSR